MDIKITNIYPCENVTSGKLPVYVNHISAGFPSPADDYLEGSLDLNKHLVRNPAATFFVRVSGDSMINAGIHNGDMLVVDRSLEASNRDVIIAALNGELTVKRLIREKNGNIILQPENPSYQPQYISCETDFQVWGVVTNVIHKL